MDQDNLDRVKKILLKANDILCENLDIGDILRKLKTKETLKPGEIQTIKKQDTDEDKVEKMLDILRRKPVSAYEDFMELLKSERKDLYLRVKKIEEEYNYQSGSSSSEEITPHKSSGEKAKFVDKPVTEKDISDIVEVILPNELPFVYTELGLRDRDVQRAEQGTNTADAKLKARAVFLLWIQRKASNATRKCVLDALETKTFQGSLEELREIWNK